MSLAVTLVTGLRGAGKSRLIARWRESSDAPVAWLIDQGDDFKLPPALRASAGAASEPDDPGIERLGGCACCTARPAFAAAVRRLMRRGAWSHLVVELNAGAHPASFIDMLRGADFVDQFRLIEVVSVIAADRLAASLAGREAPWIAEQLAVADRVLLRFATGPKSAAWREAVMALQKKANFMPRISPWPDALRLDAAVTDQWPRVQRIATGMPGADWRWVWRAGPACVFDRVRMMDAIAEAGLSVATDGVRAAMRTPREWYEWRGDSWGPTLWRRESRIEIELPQACEQSATRHALEVLEARLSEALVAP